MWSLPNISRLNAEAKESKTDFEDAVRIGFTPKLRQRVARTKVNDWLEAHPEWHGKPMVYRDGILTLGEPFECECDGWSTPCDGEIHAYLWYDIFSDDPKGILALCEQHDGYYGSPTEGYFTCDDCGRVMVENYTWEYYRTSNPDSGDTFCLPCAAAQYVADEENWITLTAKNIKAVDFERVQKAKHVIGVEMPLPKGIKLFDNVGYDSTSGGQISGGNMQEILREAKEQGYKRALLILDAAYQFAVSIGVYVDSE